jgi:hypothetical protein
MSSKITIDHYCNNCGSEYMITYDVDNQLETPNFCSFCSSPLTEEDLDFEGE